LVAATAQDIDKLLDNCAHRERQACKDLLNTVENMTDQALLAKIAVEDKGGPARLAAIRKLTDQALLAKITIEPNNMVFRKAAVEQLTDQTLLEKIALDDWDVHRAAAGQPTDQSSRSQLTFDDWEVRETAVKKLTEQKLLAKIAVEDEHPRFRMAAVKNLADQSLLAKIVIEDKDPDIRKAAIEKVTDQKALEKIAVEAKDPVIQAEAIAALDESNPALISLAGFGGRTSSGPACKKSRTVKDSCTTGKDIARIKLAIQEPLIRNRFPGIVFTASISGTSQTYGYGAGAETILGEIVSVTLSQAGKTLASKRWNTPFPGVVTAWPGTDYWPAPVQGGELLAELLRNAVFTQDDLARLSSSEIPELRSAVVANLTDQVLLAKIAVADDDWSIVQAAAGKVTDQAALFTKIAIVGKTTDVRRRAAWKLTDQTALSRVAIEAADPQVREDAVEKLTDQTALARIAVKDKRSSVREAAIKKLTDRAVLARIAVEDKDPFVRTGARQRLNQIRKNTK
jgi:hypothetical protein